MIRHVFRTPDLPLPSRGVAFFENFPFSVAVCARKRGHVNRHLFDHRFRSVYQAAHSRPIFSSMRFTVCDRSVPSQRQCLRGHVLPLALRAG